MIKLENGIFEIKGTYIELLSEMITILREFKGRFDKDDFDYCIEISRMSDKEMKTKAEKIRKNVSSELRERGFGL